MKNFPTGGDELLAAAAFTKQSAVFDDLYANNIMITYKRERVRRHVMNYIGPNSDILELNCGTGEDAIFFAKLGHRVHATDISSGMQLIIKRKLREEQLTHLVTTELRSFTDLYHLTEQGPYDVIFSNFAGLNCTDRLIEVLSGMHRLLKPRGTITIVVMPKFSLWESLLVLKGKWKTASRRWFAGKGRLAHIEGAYFKCWYYNASYVLRQLSSLYKMQHLEGLNAIAPPSYIDGFAEKYPKFWKFLTRTENKYNSWWPWKFIGDYYILSLKRRN